MFVCLSVSSGERDARFFQTELPAGSLFRVSLACFSLILLTQIVYFVIFLDFCASTMGGPHSQKVSVVSVLRSKTQSRDCTRRFILKSKQILCAVPGPTSIQNRPTQTTSVAQNDRDQLWWPHRSPDHEADVLSGI